MDDIHSYALAHWSPPWIDGGKAIEGVIQRAKDIGLGYDGWLILSFVLMKQLEHDMERVKRQSMNRKA